MTTPNDESIFTTDETIDDPSEHSSPALTPDELRAVDGFHHHLDRVDQREAFTPRSGRPRTEPESAVYIRRILDSIPAWHSVAAPPEVVEARAALDAAIEADQTARAEFANLSNREADERRSIGAAAVAGEPIPELTDWARERIIALARHDVLARQTKDAAEQYQEAVKNSLSAWRDELVSAIEPARQAALRKFRGVEEAVERFEAAKRAAAEVDAALHPDDVLPTGPLPEDVSRVLAGGSAAALGARLRSEHPVISGQYLTREDKLRPPRYVREAMAEGNLSAWTQLMAIEIRESFRFTSYTREEAKRYVPDANGELRPRDPRTQQNGFQESATFLGV